jgi:solute carrier family 27 fatty acid transporter 1/4
LTLSSIAVNYSNQDGSCGFIPQIPPDFLLRSLFPVKLVKYDEDSGNVIRDQNGFCVICGPGETGMLVSSINNNDPIKAFDGYTNKEETNKKILKNAFSKGDSVFLSGDLLHMDELGFLYFRDRTGDTFRWKGNFEFVLFAAQIV